jgi:hypothetical protein
MTEFEWEFSPHRGQYTAMKSQSPTLSLGESDAVGATQEAAIRFDLVIVVSSKIAVIQRTLSYPLASNRFHRAFLVSQQLSVMRNNA